MRISALVVAVLVSLGAGCANPLNRVTSDNYADTCAAAERNGRLDVAEQACYRALVNVDMGNLGPELKSQRLYNLARIKRQLSKFAVAEDLLKQSLPIEEQLSGSMSHQIGRRLVELATNMAGQNRWNEGAPYLIRALPIADQFSPQEKSFMRAVLLKYGSELRNSGNVDIAAQFEARAATL